MPPLGHTPRTALNRFLKRKHLTLICDRQVGTGFRRVIPLAVFLRSHLVYRLIELPSNQLLGSTLATWTLLWLLLLVRGTQVWQWNIPDTPCQTAWSHQKVLPRVALLYQQQKTILYWGIYYDSIYVMDIIILLFGSVFRSRCTSLSRNMSSNKLKDKWKTFIL